jgi:hypothetical protein
MPRGICLRVLKRLEAPRGYKKIWESGVMSIHAFKRKSVKDRPDGKYVRDITGIQALMMNIYPNRTDSEV